MRSLWIAGVAALAGIVGLALFFPRFDPAASVHLTLDRTQAIQRVRAMSAGYGVNTAGWRAAVVDQTDDELRAYRAAYPSDPIAKWMAPFTVQVALISPGGKSRVQASLSEDGTPVDWSVTGAEPTLNPGLDAILIDFTGPNRPSFSPVPASSDKGVITSAFMWSNGERFPLVAALTIKQKDGSLLSVDMARNYQPAFDNSYAAGRKNWLTRASYWFWVVCCMVALIPLLAGMFKGRVRWRVPVVLMTIQLLWAAASFWGGIYSQDGAFTRQPTAAQARIIDDNSFTDGGRKGATVSLNVGRLIGPSVFAFLGFLVFAGAGFAVRAAGNREKYLTLDLLCRGRFSNRPVGSSLSTGILCGIGLAAVPYFIAAAGFPLSDFRSMDALFAPAPVTVAIRLSAALGALLVFGLVFPLLQTLRRAPLRWALLVPLGILAMVEPALFRAVTPALLYSAIVFAASLLLYLRADLLAVMTAVIAARAAIVPCILLSQSIAPARQSALWVILAGFAAAVASVYWAVRGQEPDARPEAYAIGGVLPAEPVTRSDHERLEAEFQLARKAQEDALPDTAPQLAGYDMAGSCAPAQQVGGDLYDFFPLPDGRLGVAVANVSGKGVPAALYMMMTKGLLGAASRDTSALSHIIQQTNLHLYQACRRRVFVTLAAVVLDPASRKVQYGRAGHNPVVVRRPRSGDTSLLKPPGLGLGLAGADRFARSLAIEDFHVEPGDAIVLYSDGVTEAINSNMDQFGEERLMRSVSAADGQSAEDTRASILRDLSQFMGATPARDDITLVVIRAV